MLLHVTFWVASVVIAFGCFMYAWHLGKDGLDDRQVVKDMWRFQTSEFWVGLGAALVLLSFLDAFTLFNPIPPSLDRGPAVQ